ncbi:catalase [Virgibacillus kimchii]
MDRPNRNKKQEQLEKYRVENTGKRLTTGKGLKVSNNEETLKAGPRGPALMEDFHFFEKQMHFDREKIPERAVQARGFGAHGEFELYTSMRNHTKAGFLQHAGTKTPVFARFSNMQGYRGSSDTTLGARGFSVKFYTEEGNYDLLGISFPAFALHDAFKLADIIHALNPEPHNDIPQASAAHDNFWDFIVRNQETAHFVMWAMSDRTAPRSWRMMAGYSVNTFRFVNEQGEATFVRFHWKPVLGVHSLLVEEALTIAGINPDFHRQDLWDAIENGMYPEYELGVQMIDEADEFKYEFDVLDPTKLWPEEVVPVKIIGKMKLNKNVDNFFSEVEQVAFNPANVVPGIDFSNAPVLQGRLFAYEDTQMHRIGSPNFKDLPINRPICPIHNNQQGGYMRSKINVGSVNYYKNSLAKNTPAPTPPEEGGYVHYPERVEGRKVKATSDSFKDYFSQARMVWNSMSAVEKQHITQAFSFMLGNVKSKSVRQQAVDMFSHVDIGLATAIADYIDANPPSGVHVPVETSYPSLSQLNTPKYAYSLKVGVLISDGFNGGEVKEVIRAFESHGILYEIIGKKFGSVTGTDGTSIDVDATFLITDPALYDSLYIAGGSDASLQQDIMNFVGTAYKHYKPIGVGTTGEQYIKTASQNNLKGVVFATENTDFAEAFVSVIGEQRFWERT